MHKKSNRPAPSPAGLSVRVSALAMALVLALVLALPSSPAAAASLAASGSPAVLGQPLDFAVPLRLSPGEAASAQCVDAEVTVGQRRLPASMVTARLEPQGGDAAIVRVRTSQAVDEPAVKVVVHVGCSNRLSRSYVLLAEPATRQPVPAAAAANPRVTTVTSATVPATTAATAPAPTRSAAVPPRPGPVAAPATAAARPAGTAGTAGTAAAADAGPRLRLDAAELPARAEPDVIDIALEAVAEATKAVRATAAAASAANARAAELEGALARLDNEARASRDEAAALRAQLASVDAGGERWQQPLLLMVVVLAALAGWLAWRLRALENERRQSWRAGAPASSRLDATFAPSSAEPAPDRQAPAAIPIVSSVLTAPDTVPRPPAPASGSAEDRATMRTEVLPHAWRPDAGTPRDVSIDELIDLEQQAEFFLVLGQDDAAIDLLVQHLRDTAGASPLPYLKLMEIQHRRGDRDDYERTRTRFNLRFNAYAPAWGADLRAGRSLEEYPDILRKLQQVWPRPMDAMAELESLLFRKKQGELFELPAYREVLFLYSLARDLADREALETGQVDLLLPLAEAGDGPVPTPPRAGDGRVRRAGADAPTTGPVDLDLSQSSGPSSIFGAAYQDTQPPRG